MLFLPFMALLCCLTGCNPPKENLSLTDWMKSLSGDTRICKMSIPATHDSGALLGGEGLQCQDITLSQQLEKGIRGFDIRLKADSCGKLGVYHSRQYQEITWEDHALPDFLRFLQQHPDEMLVVSVKCEGGSKEGYRELLSASLGKAEHQPFFVRDFHAGITLDECRGKILFLQRSDVGDVYPGVRCIDWKDNATFDMPLLSDDGATAQALVEDVYFHESVAAAPYKADITFENMQACMKEPAASDKWFISFASATAVPHNGPRDFSDVVNGALVEKLKGAKGSCGMVLMDFAGSEDGMELTKRLIETNNRR